MKKKICIEPFTVEVDDLTSYGWFEHNTLGDECGGGLWFDGLNIDDYDGVAELPTEVIQALEQLGYIVGEGFR